MLNPITALTSCRDASGRVFALAGEDAWLKVYDVDSNRLLGQLRIFHSQSIHGIYASQPDQTKYDEAVRILIWGGQSVAILPYTALQTLCEGHTPAPPNELKAPDWIYDGILFSSGALTGALVTAHNEIVPITSTPNGTSFSFGALTSPSRPILYSANLCQLSPDTILVAGGTVFGEIIVWKYYLDVTRPSQLEVLFVFTGHEGSIFGVSISPEIEIAPGTRVRLLASCSDDRTVRVWDITDRSTAVVGAGGGEASQIRVTQEARETGFGENSEARPENRNDSSKCVAVEMGHISRIWHVKFTGRTDYHSEGESPVEIYSFGEDCTRQKWELSLDLPRWREAAGFKQGGGVLPWAQPVGKLRNCGAISCHGGKNIWSATVAHREESLLLMSGGADGRIVVSRGGETPIAQQPLVNGSSSMVNYGDVDTRFSFDEFLWSVQSSTEKDSSSPAILKIAKEGFYRYAFLSESTLLVTAASGRLFIGTFGNSIVWEELAVPEAARLDIASFHMLASPTQGTAVLGSLSGRLYLLNEAREIRELAQLPAKITDIICPGQSGERVRSGKPQTQILFVSVLGQDHAMMFEYENSTGEIFGDLTEIKYDNSYQNYIPTAANYCGNDLILGSRVGAITLYERTADSWTQIESRKDCKDKDAITTITPLPGSSTAFLTTCRDGRYRLYTIENQDGKTTMHLQHETSPPLGMIEGAQFSKHNGAWELILHGFRGKHFVVWNETLRQELAAVECGGANRPFSYTSSSLDPGRLIFVYTKVSQMGMYAQSSPALRVLKEGTHGREIRAVAACDAGYVATAAEDTTIRVWHYKDSVDPTCRGFKCLAVMEKHSAGIQALQWHGDNYLVSSAGNEELFIWHVTRVDSDYEALAVVCEAVYPDRTTDGDLRIMNLDVQSWPGSNDDDEMLISLALSNSTLRTYRYSKHLGFTLLSNGHYTGACFTQIRHLRASEHELHVLTASTDGNLAIWSSIRTPSSTPPTSDPTPPLPFPKFTLITATRLHQSTLKSMDISSNPSLTSWLVVSGGDDNALGFADISFDPSSGEFTIVSKARVKSAHAAAVTGLSILRAEGEVAEVTTVSNDQRVKVWRVTRGNRGRKGMKVEVVEDRYSSVADPADLEVICPGMLVVGGVGLEVWEV